MKKSREERSQFFFRPLASWNYWKSSATITINFYWEELNYLEIDNNEISDTFFLIQKVLG